MIATAPHRRRRLAVVVAALAATVVAGVWLTVGRGSTATGSAGPADPVLVQPGRRLVVPTAPPLSAACLRAQQEQARSAPTPTALPTPADSATAFLYVTADAGALPECRGQVPADPVCSMAYAQPAGAPPVPVPYELRAERHATAKDGSVGYRTDPDGLTTLLLVVEPGAGMPQRVADVAQVPVRVELGGRVVRVRFDPRDPDVQLDLAYLPGVWGMSVDPAARPRILGEGEQPPADPQADAITRLEQFVADTTRTTRDLQQNCAATTRTP